MNINTKEFIKKIRSITNQIPIPPLIDRNDYRKSIFIAGSGRSGTTWLQEIINYHNDYRVMFEPFYPQKVNIVNEWHPFQYLRKENIDPRYLRPAEAILCGNVKNNWVDKYNKRLISQRRVIKDIRANLFLHWMKEKFPEIPIVLIMRHPCAVANSKSQGNWANNLEHYLSQEDLMEDYLYQFETALSDSKTRFEKHIFSWCIENYLPLQQFTEGEILISFYENLCTKPKEEIQRIFNFLGKTYTPRVLRRISIPSLESSKRSAIVSGSDLVSSWRKNVSDEQIKKSVRILSFFGLDMIYNDRDLPLVSGKSILRNR